MPYRFFAIPVHDPAVAETELNAVLSTHRIVAVDRRFVDRGSQSFWAVSVEYIAGQGGRAVNFSSSKERIDYKEKLTPEQFKVFAYDAKSQEPSPFSAAMATFIVRLSER